jgi:hypothetical protein
MIKTLEQAIAEVERLPAEDQEQIGRTLLSHVEKLRALRAEIDKGRPGGGRCSDQSENRNATNDGVGHRWFSFRELGFPSARGASQLLMAGSK